MSTALDSSPAAALAPADRLAAVRVAIDHYEQVLADRDSAEVSWRGRLDSVEAPLAAVRARIAEYGRPRLPGEPGPGKEQIKEIHREQARLEAERLRLGNDPRAEFNRALQDARHRVCRSMHEAGIEKAYRHGRLFDITGTVVPRRPEPAPVPEWQRPVVEEQRWREECRRRSLLHLKPWQPLPPEPEPELPPATWKLTITEDITDLGD
jgi:hypothetical protein